MCIKGSCVSREGESLSVARKLRNKLILRVFAFINQNREYKKITAINLFKP